MFALASDYPFLDIMWTMFIFFAWLIWISLLVLVLAGQLPAAGSSGLGEGGLDSSS